MKDQTRYMLIVAGDSNQSIYSKDPQYQEAVVIPEKITQLIDSEDWGLLYVYRLTRSIITAIQKMIPSMNIFSAKRYMLKRDTQIRLCKAEFLFVFKNSYIVTIFTFVIFNSASSALQSSINE